MHFSELNFFAIFFAALASFLLGAVWYSPLLFKRIWMESCGLTELDLQSINPVMVFGGSFVLCCLIAFSLSLFIGANVNVGVAVGTGFIIGLCWVSCALGIGYIFEQRPLKLFLVNASYSILQFSVIGLVLGLWP
ncbi:DUF1761 domain-containing protein [Pseudoalteromonas shioyasakiensis]|uniref:DUF1761 domain-containing protein n=1 Tax=Pseudoalteromonas shioyasakiensis TaxID=1190813 RepID=A0ABT6TXI4_9GAMM|nr:MULTISPECIES: DUF1761 domain-containing protein [Pseudoalteromonas]MDI4668621.1 DUF1761 domain-containing protein [Pseudoalteromonas shioyasakiensis]MDI4673746.1 DUF1761 domain-containing protein [Pseudoalteromonas shioyasakiensis]MDI4685705.1 DUF1761 domain-containing protein [Pseudoalteromonas shioyasakiensis]MDI4703823.1 DUF1761 domain-containing protein [Pseudoalteromonas shioyasakiensis]NUJ20868.1 DUF1761 domain-containing protein [Pseudoalteromonas sp. 0802]